jgi:transposase-like protein
MDFPITELLDYESSAAWIVEHSHPTGLKCPMCGKPQEQAREFLRTQRRPLAVYRCRGCHRIYNLYSGTILTLRHAVQLNAEQAQPENA